MKELLEIPCYLCIFTDHYCIDEIKKIRQSFDLDELTHYIMIDFKDTPKYQYVELVRENRKKYHPTRDERTCPETHILTVSKFDFVLQTMDINPFNTTKFGWIDANVGINFSKICIDYKNHMLLGVLHNSTEKFHIQILNSEDKKYLKTENLKEYYEKYRWVVCGCLFITGKEIGIKILNDLNSIVMKHTMLGYGHGEEMFYLEILEKYYDDIIKGYGEYNTIINNITKITTGSHYIYHVIILGYLQNGYHKECVECCEKLLEAFDNFVIEMNYDIYLLLIFTYYVALYYIDKTNAKELAHKILQMVDKNPYMKKEFEKNKDYYNDQLKYVM
jgi:hypothetical protein